MILDEPTQTPSMPAGIELVAGDQLTLDGLHLTPLGARITGPVDTGAVLAQLVRLRKAGAAWRWLVGDLVLALTAEHDGDLAYAWQQVASLDLDDRPSLAKSVAVSQRIPLGERRSDLSWSHHEAVAGIADPDERSEWLGAAAVNQWTVRELRTELDQAYTADAEQPELEGADGPMLPPHLPKKTVHEIDGLWARDPDAAVIVRSDGTWRVFSVDMLGQAS